MNEKWQLEPDSAGAVGMNFERTLRDLKLDGCKEQDIIGLIKLFVQREQEIEASFSSIAVSEAEVKRVVEIGGKKDIGDGIAPSVPQQYIKLSDLQKLIQKVEDVVDTELGTLRNHILSNSSARKQYLSLSQFKEHFHNWAIEVWRDRMPAELRNQLSDDQISQETKKSSRKNNKSKMSSKKGNILVLDDPNLLQDGNNPPSPPRSTRKDQNVLLTEEQKSKKYSNRLLLFKLEQYKLPIERLLDHFVQNKTFQNIDCKRYFDELFEQFQNLVKIAICKHTDVKRQMRRKTDPACHRQLKEFFLAAFKDKNGESFFYKYEFYDGLKKFFQEQERIIKATKDLTGGETIIIIDKSDEFEKYLKDGVPIQRQPSEERVSPKNDVESLDNQIKKLYQNIANCEKLLQSGQVKDFKRKENLLITINQFKIQIKELEKKKPSERTELFQKQKYASLKSSLTPSKASYLKSIAGISLDRSPQDSTSKLLKLNKKSDTKKQMSKQDIIDNSVKETFDFYARQHIANNQGFEEMFEGLKKIDLGEFNGFLRDFKISLPRQKTNDLFLKAGNNLKEIEFNEFKKAILLVGQEYATAKLRETRERHKEWNKIIEDLKIPESYPNTAGTHEFRRQLLELLEKKCERFSKYVDNNLRQKTMLTDQMPLARGKMKFKNKNTTIAGAQLVLKEANPDDELRKPTTSFPDPKTDPKNPKNKEESPPKSKLKAQTDDNTKSPSSKRFSLPVDSSVHASQEGSPGQNKGSPEQNKQGKQGAIDSYLIRLNKMDQLKLPPNQVKSKIKERIENLKSQIDDLQKNQTQRLSLRAEKLNEKQEKQKQKAEKKQKNKEEKEQQQKEQEEKQENDQNEKKDEDAPENKTDETKNENEQNNENAENEDEKNEDVQNAPKELTSKKNTEKTEQNADGDDDTDEEEPSDTDEEQEGLTEDETEMIEEYTLKIQDLEEQLVQDDEQIKHPIYHYVSQIQNEITNLEQIVRKESYEEFIFENVCEFHVKNSYRKKIKGFHLAFNAKDKFDENPQSKYKNQISGGSAEQLRLAALDRKNQRLYRQQMAEQEKDEKHRKDKMKLRALAEQTRAYKHEELLKLGRDLQLEGTRKLPAATLDGGLPNLLQDDDRSTSPLAAYLSDPKNYQAIREKQLLLERSKTLEKNQNRIALQGLHQKQYEKLSLQERREKEVEDIVMKPGVTFDDLEKLDYADINALSNKYGEEVFDPKKLLDFDSNGSDDSDDNEILRKYKAKQKAPSKNQRRSSNFQALTSTPNMLHQRKYSKPSAQSQVDSTTVANYPYLGHDRTAGSQDLAQLSNLPGNYYDAPGAKAGLIASAHDIVGSPMYSPVQRHNPKRKFQEFDANKLMADNNSLSRQFNDDVSNAIAPLPRGIKGPQSVNAKQNRAQILRNNFKSGRDNSSNSRNPGGRHLDAISLKNHNLQQQIPNEDMYQKPNTHRNAGLKLKQNHHTLNASPSYKSIQNNNNNTLNKYKLQALKQAQPSQITSGQDNQLSNMLALPSPFDPITVQNSQLPPQHPNLPSGKRNKSNNNKNFGGPQTIDYGYLKNKKLSNNDDIQSQYSIMSAINNTGSPVSHMPGNNNAISHMKNQSLIRAQQLQQIQNDKNSKLKMQMDGYMKQQDRNIRKGIKAAMK